MMKTVALVAVAVVLTGIVAAQQPAFKRTVLQQADISVPGREVVSAVAEFEPRATPGMHTHFGEEIGYVIEGTFLIEQAGKPPGTLPAGGAFLISGRPGDKPPKTRAGEGRMPSTHNVWKSKPPPPP